MSNELEKISKALFKRAVGYNVDEVVEEYLITEEDGQKLTKKKKTIKNVPPDISATKLYLELNNINNNEYKNYSNQKLDEEINRLKQILNNIS